MTDEEKKVEVREFDLEEWLTDGIHGFRSRLKCKRPVLPDEFKHHARAARKEMLLSVRSLLDAAIKEFEEEPKTADKAA